MTETSDREPTLVRQPKRIVPEGARLVRLRLPDRPGSLARVTEHFAAHQVNVLRLEVVGQEGGFAIDDFLVSGTGLASALASFDPSVVVLADRANVDLVDPGLAMASACAVVTFAENRRDAYAQLLQAALELVFAEAGVVCAQDDFGLIRPLASTVPGMPAIEASDASLLGSALFSGECLTADGRAPWAPEGYRSRLPGGAVAVIPGGAPSFLVLTLVRRDDAPFVSAELRRLAALVMVAVGTLQLHDVNASLASRQRESTSWHPARRAQGQSGRASGF